ncbi:hypothetical protein GCM10009665_09430 [Kitasatospora nipponensis]|uniref:DUF5667 domain-containing protein n=1 Tax=Kitasatospora nipponensis TaxID=258049 RepID=A0ABN1VS92_9ACTN
MTANVLEHRRARAFAEALAAHRTGQPASTAAMGQLLDTADALGAITAPGLDVEVRTVQRAQLMAAFEQVAAGGGLPTVPHQRRHRAERGTTRRRWSRRFAITGLVAGVTVGSFAGVAAASSQALPGDTLYGMKRGLEGLRFDLAGSDSERGALLLDQASTRLAEARSLVGRGGGTGALSPDTVDRLGSALRDMHAEAAKGRDLLRSVYRANGSLDPMRKLAAFTDGQDDHWAALQGRLPAQLTPEAGQVDQLFGDISADVAPLHLAPEQPRPSSHPLKPSTGDSSGPAADQGASPGGRDGGGSAAPATPGGRAGSAQPSAGAAVSQGGGASPALPAGGNPVGGLVNGLTGSLSGAGSGASAGASPGASSTPQSSPQSSPVAQPGASAPASAPPVGGGAPLGGGQGLNLPPLIPGLLPGLGLDGS